MGYDDWFSSHTDPERAKTHDIARVISVHKTGYLISRGNESVFAELSGTLMYSAQSSLELPTTGDWVFANFYDDDSQAIIHELIPRKTLLRRKSAGKSVEFQLLAANLDTAFIVQSLDENLNLRRMERYLVMVGEANIAPYILLSKCDLLAEQEVSQKKQLIASIEPETPMLAFSNLTGENIEHISQLLTAGQTYCLLGSSGVGKTSLLNSLLGNEQFATQTVSRKQSKGRHTTTSRELVQMTNGAVIIDTPGMRELGIISVEEGLDKTFSEILELSRKCKYTDCAHINEKGCAILKAIDNQHLSFERYQNYQKIKKESDFNEMSYSEKRRVDKEFGKLVKSVTKRKQKLRGRR